MIHNEVLHWHFANSFKWKETEEVVYLLAIIYTLYIGRNSLYALLLNLQNMVLTMRGKDLWKNWDSTCFKNKSSVSFM